MQKLAPILLFVFARPAHTKQTLEFLAANDLASDSDLIVYADASRNEKEIAAVNEVRRLVNAAPGFRSVTVVERMENYGLARNIIEGVEEVCKKYGRVIVLEDDLITSPKFLTFMNQALDRYQDEKRVWHISGWNYPINTEGLDDAFFLRVMNCWGWATWADRWQHFEKDTNKLIVEFDRDMIRKFDLENSGAFWSQVISNQKGLVNTWAIYWYATIFKNNGLCLNPASSYVDNIGLDGSGTHGSQERNIYATKLSKNNHPSFPSDIKENVTGIDRIIQFYQRIKPTIVSRIKARISFMLRKAGLK
ncbi:glycosyltransferase family 2 protein [Malikia spinosa]|uniref:glycosyltransferase family 2 protein n=1 Tax=Malikia spinosa TaxID=86180 RepID=UPI003FA1F04D